MRARIIGARTWLSARGGECRSLQEKMQANI
jgi:hypothetical protein